MPGMNTSWNYSSSTSGPMMGPLKSAYQQALKMSNNSYAKILQGYSDVASQYRSDRAQALGYFDQTQQNVMAQMDLMGASQKQDIMDQYAAATGNAKQDLINKGLGNTTVQSSVQRGLDYDRAKAEVALTGALAGVKAGALQNIGTAKAGGALTSAGTLAGIMGQGWSLQAQGAGQRAGLASSYMNQLRNSQSVSMGGSQGYQYPQTQFGGGGGGHMPKASDYSYGGGGGQVPYTPQEMLALGRRGNVPDLPTGGSTPYVIPGSGGGGGFSGWTGSVGGSYPTSQGYYGTANPVYQNPAFTYPQQGGFGGGFGGAGGGGSYDPLDWAATSWEDAGYGSGWD